MMTFQLRMMNYRKKKLKVQEVIIDEKGNNIDGIDEIVTRHQVKKNSIKGSLF
jgi:hypothetical protein